MQYLKNVGLVVFALTLCLATLVRADVITLKSGTKVVGTIKDAQEDPVVIVTLFGEQRIAHDKIANVKICPTPWDEFARRMDKIGSRDLESLIDLMDWAHESSRKSFLAGKLKRLYRKVIRLDKDNAMARKGLGYKKIGGEWLSKAEVKRRKKEADAKKSAAADKLKAERDRRDRALRLESDVGMQMEKNAARDQADAKVLSDCLTGELNVGTSKRISIAGPIAREGIKPLLELGERALTTVCAEMRMLGGAKHNPGSAGARSVYHHYFVRQNDRKAIIDFIHNNYGLSQAFYTHMLRSKSSGLAANVGRPVAFTVEKQGVNRKDALLHNLGHCIVGSAQGSGNVPPWLQEGFGMYMSIRFIRNTGHFCTTISKYAHEHEVAKKNDEASWNLLVRDQVVKGFYPRFDTLCAKKLNRLDAKDLARSWAICNCLMSKDPRAFKSFVSYCGIKKEVQQRAVKAAYDWAIPQLDEYVNKWVLGTVKTK